MGRTIINKPAQGRRRRERKPLQAKLAAFLVVAATSLSACSEKEQAQEVQAGRPVAAGVQGEALADSIYINGFVYTVNPEQPTAEALAVKEGRIVLVGSDEEVQSLASEQTRVVDLEGRMLMPGIHDMHVHPKEAGENHHFQCGFPFTFTVAEIVEKLKDCAAQTPPGEWVRGGQWAMELMESDTVPHRKILDAVTTAHPVYLGDSTVHAAWLNSPALEALGIDGATADPPGGVIVREADSGAPTGVLIDNAAYDVLKALPPYTDAQYQTALAWAMRELNKVGVTAIKDAIADRHALRAYRSLDESGLLTMKVSASLPWRMAWADDREQELENVRRRAEYATKNVGTDFIKIMLDGIPPTRTSAMLAPYLPDGKHGDNFSGKLIHAPEQLAEDLIKLDGAGLTVKIHATGDRAARVALDAIEAARKANGPSGLRHEISHAEWVHPDDIPRFKALNAVAEFSPILWYPTPLQEVMAEVVGEEMAGRMWPIKSLLEAGAGALYGSDWPSVVPDPNPWPGLEAMVTRRDPYLDSDEALWPEQAIDLAAAVRIFTINGASAAKRDDETGSLEVGKSADFIIIDRNIFAAPVEDISETQVVMTVIAGREVYRF